MKELLFNLQNCTSSFKTKVNAAFSINSSKPLTLILVLAYCEVSPFSPVKLIYLTAKLNKLYKIAALYRLVSFLLSSSVT